MMEKHLNIAVPKNIWKISQRLFDNVHKEYWTIFPNDIWQLNQKIFDNFCKEDLYFLWHMSTKESTQTKEENGII